LSYTEKLLEELERSPELAQRFRKTVENILLNEVLLEQRALRSDFNRLLEEQKKLREDFNREIKLLREDFNKLSEEQKRLREDFVELRADFTKLSEEQKKLAEEQKRLREDFNKLSEEQKKLAEEQKKLAEEQKRLREDFVELRADFTKLSEEQKRLREDFNKMLQELTDLRRGYRRLETRIQSLHGAMLAGFGELSKFAGITFEEFSRKFLENYLKAQGVLPKNRYLTKYKIDSEEIDIFCDNPAIVGEVTAYAQSAEEVDKLLKKVELVRGMLTSEPRKYLIVLTAPKEVARSLERLSEEKQIELVIGKIV
jgi:uncharacterized phage infection (PIP) family protein YhgE